jgi:hypothetical protein
MVASLLVVCLGLAAETYQQRVAAVTRTPGFAALWDFVKRDPADRRFDAWQNPAHTRFDLRLDAVNYVRDYWGEGRAATYNDIPVVDEGPFGKAIHLRTETDPKFRPLLMIPRSRLQRSPIDVHGPGQSVTLLVWLKRMPDSGNHAVAGIWHEGTDLRDRGSAAKRVEPGQRQYAIFSGLAANDGASAAHVSENGGASFGDKYARNLSVTPEKIPIGVWTAVALVFDNRRDTVTSFVDGKASAYWIRDPASHPFFQWPARAWERAEYGPPRQFTRIRDGKLQALRVNPYWFPHDLYAATAESGGPFTIGRVIHMGRNGTSPGLIGGVAVFDRALTARQIRKLSRFAP